MVRGAQPGVRGQRLAGLAHEIFLKLLKAKREVPGAAERQKTLAAQDGKCALCGCGLTGTCELDHVVPVRQAFAGSVQTLQALCGDCHSEKTLRESAQPTSLESRVAPGVMEYVRSPKLPPLVFEAQACAKDALCVGVDVVRCRRNGLANAPFPLPILCPADGVEPVDGVLPDLGFVEGCCDARQSCLNLLPYVGPGWYPKVSLAAMLELGVCRWDHIVLGISARSHVDAATLRCALERMDAAWPDGEEHMAKLSVNAMIGLWARSTEVVYSVRSSSSELDGAGADFSQTFAYEGGMVWDFVYARRLLSNGTYRPIHDAVLGFERCMVAKARRILDAPPRYLAQVKTDCLLTQRLPKRFAERLRALEALRHPDGAPVYRVEETKPLLGSRAPHMEAERPKQRRWNGVDDPISHCLAGNSLLHGPAGHRKDAPGPDHCGEAARAGRGGAPGVQDALLRAEPGPGGADGRPLGAQERARGQRAKAGLAGGGGDHAAGHGALGGPGLRGAERRREVPAAGRLPAVAGRAGLLGRAAHQRAVGAQPARPRPDRRAQARAHGERALRPRHLQLREVAAGRRGGVPHAGAGQGEAEGALPLQARVAGHHAGHQPQQAHGRPGAGGLKAPRVGDT